MSLLEAHLEQIKYSCQGIDSLPFPPPKIFTNALLSSHDITSLIRDTEAHERALFSVPAPPAPPSSKSSSYSRDKDKSQDLENTNNNNKPFRRRQTIFNVAEGEVTTGPPPRSSSTTTTTAAAAAAARRRINNTAVAAVLGGEMHDQLRKGGTLDRKGDMDVEILLRGAEKLCTVYELPGARERIAALRGRNRNGRNTMEYYEARVAEQGDQLAAMNGDWMDQDQEDEDGDGGATNGGGDAWTEEDLRREEEEARQMEVKKRELQVRLRSMEKDLRALRNM